MSLASGAARFVVRELERFAGATVLSTISEFFQPLPRAVDAWSIACARPKRCCIRPRSASCWSLPPRTDGCAQARELIEEMERERLKLAAIIINRFLDEEIWAASGDSRAGCRAEPGSDRQACAPRWGDNLDRHPGVGRVGRNTSRITARAHRDIERIGAFLRSDCRRQCGWRSRPEIAQRSSGTGAVGALCRLPGRAAPETRALCVARIPRKRKPEWACKPGSVPLAGGGHSSGPPIARRL